jgi:hypothetical protein
VKSVDHRDFRRGFAGRNRQQEETMSRLILATVAAAVLAGSVLPAAVAAQPPQTKHEFEMYHVVIVKQGPKWKPYGTEEATNAQQTLIGNVEKLSDAGTLVSGGIVNDESPVELIFVFRSLTYNQIMTMIQKAPNMKNGFYAAEFYPWFAPKGLKLPPPTRGDKPGSPGVPQEGG